MCHEANIENKSRNAKLVLLFDDQNSWRAMFIVCCDVETFGICGKQRYKLLSDWAMDRKWCLRTWLCYWRESTSQQKQFTNFKHTWCSREVNRKIYQKRFVLGRWKRNNLDILKITQLHRHKELLLRETERWKIDAWFLENLRVTLDASVRRCESYNLFQSHGVWSEAWGGGGCWTCDAGTSFPIFFAFVFLYSVI